MPNWKRVHINFPTVKLGQFIEPIKETIAEKGSEDFKMVYGVTNVEGITITGKKASKDISNYIVIDKNYFAYNPYRINVGSIGFNSKGLKGCVSPAYVVFRAKNNLSPGFLYVYLKSEFGNHLINWYGNRGGVRNALRYDDLCEIDIPDIDYKTQIELLNKIDRSKIPLNSFSEEITQQLGHLKQLRQRILQEAVEGKLTTNWRDKNPDLLSGDNHASKLLEKIKAEKERLIKEGNTSTKLSARIKKDKPLLPIADAEKPFDLPEGWVWCRLGDVALHSLGKMLDKAKNRGIYRKYLRNLNVRWFTFDLSDLVEMRFREDEVEQYTARKGDLLVCEGGYPGRAAIWDQKYEIYFQKAVHRIRFIVRDMNKYFLYFLFLSDMNRYLERYFTGAGIQHFTGKELHNFAFPLPPLAEQQAIVERVDKLMAMIAELEKQVSERKDQSEMLMQSVLREVFAKK